MGSRLSLLGFVWCVASAGSAHAVQYEIADLGVEIAVNDSGCGVNDSGLVAGTTYIEYVQSVAESSFSRQLSTTLCRGKGFVFRDETLWLFGNEVLVRGVNNKGQIIAQGVVLGSYQSLMYDGFDRTVLPFTNGVFDINDQGQVLGTNDTGSRSRAAIYDLNSGVMTDLGALPGLDSSNAGGINNAGHAVGWSVGNAYLYKDGIMIDRGPGLAYEINDLDEVIGRQTSSGDGGYIYRDGEFTYLRAFDTHTSADPYTRPYDINNHSVVVGTSTHTDPLGGQHSHAFMYHHGVMTDLNDLLPEDTGWELRYAYGINDYNWIVGYGINPEGLKRAFLLRPVPEPSAVVLMALGVAGLVLLAQRGRR